GAFHGLSRERSDARKYPAIHPLESWSKYKGIIDEEKTEYGRSILFKGNEVGQMMKVVGEEGTSLEDYIIYLKSEFLDAVYLQQNSFDPVDQAVSPERQHHTYNIIFEVLTSKLDLANKEDARSWFNWLRQAFLDYNGAEWMSDEFKQLEQRIYQMIAEKKAGVEPAAARL
ncbi:MAG: V-type ATP synthase subunit A, partial [Firmicutes bacterium]|nr:V-type ATP synthase subunit A [Bacillota bacterium]